MWQEARAEFRAMLAFEERVQTAKANLAAIQCAMAQLRGFAFGAFNNPAQEMQEVPNYIAKCENGLNLDVDRIHEVVSVYIAKTIEAMGFAAHERAMLESESETDGREEV